MLMLRKFIGITLRHGRSPVNLRHIFRKPVYKNTSGGLLSSEDQLLKFMYEIITSLFL